MIIIKKERGRKGLTCDTWTIRVKNGEEFVICDNGNIRFKGKWIDLNEVVE